MAYLSVPINRARAEYLENHEDGASGGPALDDALDKISAAITGDQAKIFNGLMDE